jgi:Beta-propeller repeat
VCVALVAWVVTSVASLVASGALPVHALPMAAPQRTAPPAQTARVVASYGNLPLHFEPNQGQSAATVRFLARGPGYTLFLTPTEALLRLRPATAPTTDTAEEPPAGGDTVLRMQLVHANPQPQVSGGDPLPGQSHYFLGNDQAQHYIHVPHYAQVTYTAIYPGIDLVFYGNQRHLEYDFVVAPGADPWAIVLRFEGADHLTVDAQGDLVLHLAGGALRLHKPLVYQETDGVRQEIPGSYQFTTAQEVRFQIGTYDATRPLVIDPVLSYSTYLGGNGQDSGLAIAVDADGSAYIAGKTTSNFPTHNPLQPNPGGSSDAFVTKLNATGSALVYSTYLGGSGNDEARAIAVDSQGNAYVTGVTASANFPRVNPFQTALSGTNDAFVAKLDATGSALVYSTYLGGSSNVDEGRGIAVDTTGHAYVTGQTTSVSFPPVTPLRLGIIGSSDAFVAKLQPTGSALVYLTYLGGGRLI